MKITIAFSEPPPVTVWCALVAAVADQFPGAVLIEPILRAGAPPIFVSTTIETATMRAEAVVEPSVPYQGTSLEGFEDEVEP